MLLSVFTESGPQPELLFTSKSQVGGLMIQIVSV